MTNIDLFNALGDPTRRQLFERIRQGPCTVTELVSAVTVRQPAVSQHLQVLQVKKQGQQRIYQLNPKGLEEMRRYMEDLWDDALQAFADEAEKMANAAENVDIEASN